MTSHEITEAMLREKYPHIPAKHAQNMVFFASRVAFLGDCLATTTAQTEAKRWLEEKEDPDDLMEMKRLMNEVLDALHLYVARSVEALRALASSGAPYEARARAVSSGGDLRTLRKKYPRVPLNQLKATHDAMDILGVLTEGLATMVAGRDPAILSWAEARPGTLTALLESRSAGDCVRQVVYAHADKRLKALRQAVARRTGR